ncbi:ATP-binding protein [Bradyrhizobium sp. SZCCHNRI3042]|uniref:AlbA family DNA-binding domain-containing protein n=1 Tax=Bradyrhizobium sp. SZCCHNRI3042 TaxID=3057291 RepID=UPI0029160EA3|nr:ATP-binding protein [Bradyrhizobium sp. SZCCHNRI3042]
MKPIADWDEAYLNSLIQVGEQESLTLDYKGSAALAKGDKERNDLSKDVSAFANSAGGLLVYGIVEDKHVPIGIDTGVDRSVITKEWLESVIKSRIQPVVDGLAIKQINLPTKGADRVAYVVEVPAATSRAPHQAYDHRYYKRFNFESTPMEDYEVRDLMRRSLEFGKKYAAAWDLLVEIRRISAAATQRIGLENNWVPRERLMIGVSQDLRSAGIALVSLAKPVRDQVSQIIHIVDRFNAIVETVDPGQLENARMSDPLRGQMANLRELCSSVVDGLTEVLEREP